jgi:hypothetical protein
MLTERTLRAAIFEASEVTTPTCFVILNQRIGDAQSSASASDTSVAVKKASGWLGKLNALADSLGSIATDGVGMSGMVNSAVVSLMHDESLFLYLVDELTMEPVVDPNGVFPIEITTMKETVTKLLPMMKVRHPSLNRHLDMQSS